MTAAGSERRSGRGRESGAESLDEHKAQYVVQIPSLQRAWPGVNDKRHRAAWDGIEVRVCNEDSETCVRMSERAD